MRILIAEDDVTLANQLRDAMTQAGYVADVAHDGETAHYMGDVESYDLIILDLGLPVLDGLSVLARWRESGLAVPVLILTARDSWHEKVNGMDAGADDYVTKPFHMQELLARVRALLRRGSQHVTALWNCGPISLDTRQAQVTVHGQPLTLTAHEYRVLEFLMRNAPNVVSRTELVQHVYAQDFDRDSNTIDVFIGRLRKKLPLDSIETVRGLGYRMQTHDDEISEAAKRLLGS